jgi:hypothetical protein
MLFLKNAVIVAAVLLLMVAPFYGFSDDDDTEKHKEKFHRSRTNKAWSGDN